MRAGTTCDLGGGAIDRHFGLFSALPSARCDRNVVESTIHLKLSTGLRRSGLALTNTSARLLRRHLLLGFAWCAGPNCAPSGPHWRGAARATVRHPTRETHPHRFGSVGTESASKRPTSATARADAIGPPLRHIYDTSFQPCSRRMPLSGLGFRMSGAIYEDAPATTAHLCPEVLSHRIPFPPRPPCPRRKQSVSYSIDRSINSQILNINLYRFDHDLSESLIIPGRLRPGYAKRMARPIPGQPQREGGEQHDLLSWWTCDFGDSQVR